MGGAVARIVTGIVLAGLVVLAPASRVWAQTVYNSLTLDWTAPGDDGMVGRASYYDLRYRTVNISGTDTTGWWNAATQAAGEPAPGVSGSNDFYTLTGLTQGTTYYFVIRALDEAGNISGFSNLAVGTTQSCTPPTSAPGSFAAAADTGQVLVSWNSTGDPSAQSFNLYRAQGTSGAWTLYRNLSVGTTSFLDTAVGAGTTYRYRGAWMGSVCEGPVSSTATVTTPGNPAPPSAGAGESTVHAYPNPSSGPIRVVVNVVATGAQLVELKLYDLTGHWIATVVSATYPPGSNQMTWGRVGRDGRTVTPGYYELLGTVGDTRVRERIILLP